MKRAKPAQKPIPRAAFEEMAKRGFVAIQAPDETISFVPADLTADAERRGCKRYYPNH